MNNPALAIIALILCSFFACKTSPSEEQPTSEELMDVLTDNEHIDSVLDSLVANDLVPFVYARIEGVNGQTLYEHSAVNEDLYPQLKVDKDSWFRIWSMSKIVTISVVMDLVEDGILTLDEPVSKYIPEFEGLQVATAANGKPITDFEWDERDGICPLHYLPMEKEMTILHLINHQAGFYYPWTGITCLDSIWQARDLNSAQHTDELISLLAEMPLVQQPGSTYYYGLNTTVLGFVAERATGQSLKELVAKRITRPLGIEGLQYTQAEAVSLLPRSIGKDSLEPLSPKLEEEVFGAQLPGYKPDKRLYLGGEGMLATTDAYADFARMLLQKGTLNGYRLLEEATIEEMASPHTQKDSPWGYNGYNLWVTGDTLKQMGTGEAGLWVGGGYEGTYFWIDRKRQFVAFAMTQMFQMKTAPSDIFRKAVYQELWKKEEL
jgi:CubicO group peptidase (beta-lactamase class C family)